MKIFHVVIHELEKEQGKIGASLTLFNSAIDKTDERVIKLITELNNRYKNRSETYGIFDEKEPTVFHRSFEQYYNNQIEDEFIKFASESSQDLKLRIDSISPARGGYLIFAHYEQNRNFVGIFLVRNITSLSLRKNTKSKKFDLDNVKHIDFENLAMACRISINSYEKNEIRYLSFVNRRGDAMSQYFTRWISATDTETNEEDTNLLYKLLKKVPPPIDPATNKEMERELFFENVHSYIKGSKNLVNIRNLSESLFNDENFLSNQIEKQELKINGEFKAHSRALKKFVQIKAKADGVDISFPFSALKKIVRLDEKDKSQIIIKSESLVKQIKNNINTEE
ncbi:MAG: nucleoid-associated protein [Flavobacteriales bacterium]